MSKAVKATVKLGSVPYSTIETELKEMRVADTLHKGTAYSYIYYHRKSLGKAIQIGHTHYYQKERLRSAIESYVAERTKPEPEPQPEVTISSLPTTSASNKDVAQLLSKVMDKPDLAKILLELLS